MRISLIFQGSNCCGNVVGDTSLHCMEVGGIDLGQAYWGDGSPL